MTALEYAFIVFSIKITVFWCIIVHRFYVDKWPNSRYSFNN